MVADVIFCDGCRRMVHCCSCETINPRTGFRSPPPTTEWRRAPDTVCTTCYLVTGGLIGCLLTLWLR